MGCQWWKGSWKGIQSVPNCREMTGIGGDVGEDKTLNTQESGGHCNMQENMAGDYSEDLGLLERQNQ